MPPQLKSKSNLPSPDDIRAAVNRIIVSDVFSSSSQLSAFLSYVVEATLRGKTDRIKAYTIGVEVLRRDLKFDPQFDPIVRVEATRLRRAIQRYYYTAGATDPVIIDIPTGSYVPVFRLRDEAGVQSLVVPNPPNQIQAPSAARAPFAPARTHLAVIVGFAVAIAVAVFAATYESLEKPVAAETAATDPVGSELSQTALQPSNGMPKLGIQKFEVVGHAEPRLLSAAALQGKLQSAFAQFDAINIAMEPLRETERLDYRMLGFIEYHDDRTISVRFRLQDIGDGNIVWSRAFDRQTPKPDRAALEDEIVSEVASTLLQPFGVIRSRERVKALTTNSGDPRYRCLLLTSDAFRSFDPTEHDLARSCLENLTTTNPSFGDGFSYLASVYNREFVYGFGKSADDPKALDRALQLARRGFELNPVSARSNQVLSTVLFTRRETTAAFAALERAMTLNPYDVIIGGEYGGRLITSGEVERGMVILRRVAGFSRVHPSWHHFYLFLGSYLAGDLREATRQAAEMTSDTYTHGLVARALVAAANGDRKRVQGELEKLIALRPAWRTNARGELEKYISADFIVERLLRDLTAAGLLEIL